MMRKFKNLQWVIPITVILLAYVAMSAYVLFSLSLPSLTEGLKELRLGQTFILKDPTLAAQHFDEAGSKFELSSQSLRQSPLIFKLFTLLPPFRWQVSILKATHSLAGAGRVTSSLTQSFPSLIPKFDKSINSILTHGSLQYFLFYNDHATEITTLQNQLQEADTELQSVPSWIGFSQQKSLADLKQRVHQITAALPVVVKLTTEIQNTLGKNDTFPHTFLILFQNNAELRPSGGFLGSYATLTSSSGRIRSFSFGENIYTLDKSLPLSRALPPVPLQTITPHFDFQDSTVGTGFLTDSTEHIARSYQDATHITIDGCIYVDTSVLEDILDVTGPVMLPGKNLSIDSHTVRLALTNEVEKNYFSTTENQSLNQPKQIIADLMPALLAKITSTPGAFTGLTTILERNILSKSIQLSLPHTSLSPILQAILPADYPPPVGSWIKVVNTNLGGQKSSLNVTQDVAITQTEQRPVQRLLIDLRITRTHRGSGIWPDADNVNFIEVYLPSDAKLVTFPTSIGGDSKLDEDAKKHLPTPPMYPVTEKSGIWTRVGWWGTTKVGQTTNYDLMYTIPYTTQSDTYLTYIKQAGSRGERLHWFSFDGPVTTNLFLTK